MKFAGHMNMNTFFDSYMCALSTVDGQASYFGLQPRKDHIEDLRSLSLYRIPHLMQALPAEQQYELESSPELCAIEDEILDITIALRTTPEGEARQRLVADREKLYEHRRKIRATALAEYRKDQSPAEVPNFEGYHRSWFAHAQVLMPERRRLATELFIPADLRSTSGRNVLRDMLSLCEGKRQITYPPSLCPQYGRCPQEDCAIEVDR
jgi:hypothetical protein